MRKTKNCTNKSYAESNLPFDSKLAPHLISKIKISVTPNAKLTWKVINSWKDNWYLGKYADIERVNKILLTKMSNIMQESKPKLYNPGKSSRVLI